MTEVCIEEPSVFKENLTLQSRIERSALAIAPVWPLKTAIACNPLLHLEHRNFWDALSHSQAVFKKQPNDQTRFANHLMIKWLQVFLDEGQAHIEMPLKHLGFYRAWKELSVLDRELIQTKEQRDRFSQLPEDALAAVSFLLKALELPDWEVDRFLAEQFGALPGWAGYVRYRSEWGEERSDSIDLIQFMAVRLAILWVQFKSIDFEMVEQIGTKHDIRNEIEQREKEFEASLIPKIASQIDKNGQVKNSFDAQFVFCIDVRSEPFRRSLEHEGNYQTFGFAGFFGIPVAICKEPGLEYSSCPVLLKPRWKIFQKSPKNVSKTVRGIGKGIYKELKYRFATAFSLVESIGFWSGLWMILKSLFPQMSPFHSHEEQTSLRFDGIPFEVRVQTAETALKMMGLVDNFAPIVVFCGHASQSQNNPSASSLDCGACGGNRGGPNARLLASILNCREVRIELKKRQIDIPKDTLFVGAEHNTTTDEVVLFLEKDHHEVDFKKIRQDLNRAKERNRSIRNRGLSQNCELKGREFKLRGLDWSEVRPEWGLAKNSAFLVGPRWLSKSLDLEGRCFLHSYDWMLDPEGNFLETILTAPMVVAEWINTQYFFSTIDPILYGSGSKITQNVVGKMGVMQGNASDLMHGLSLQSLHSTDLNAYHEPLRLLTLVFAPIERIDAIIQKQPILQKLFLNEWVILRAIDPRTQKIFRFDSNGEWSSIDDQQIDS